MTKEEKESILFAIRLLEVNASTMKEWGEMTKGNDWAKGYSEGLSTACDVLARSLLKENKDE